MNSGRLMPPTLGWCKCPRPHRPNSTPGRVSSFQCQSPPRFWSPRDKSPEDITCLFTGIGSEIISSLYPKVIQYILGAWEQELPFTEQPRTRLDLNPPSNTASSASSVPCQRPRWSPEKQLLLTDDPVLSPAHRWENWSLETSCPGPPATCGQDEDSGLGGTCDSAQHGPAADALKEPRVCLKHTLCVSFSLRFELPRT